MYGVDLSANSASNNCHILIDEIRSVVVVCGSCVWTHNIIELFGMNLLLVLYVRTYHTSLERQLGLESIPVPAPQLTVATMVMFISLGERISDETRAKISCGLVTPYRC